jgi:hypothetical protein
MKTLFLRSSFMLFASAISFANIDTEFNFDKVTKIVDKINPSQEAVITHQRSWWLNGCEQSQGLPVMSTYSIYFI